MSQSIGNLGLCINKILPQDFVSATRGYKKAYWSPKGVELDTALGDLIMP
jgi:hypothetical protein